MSSTQSYMEFGTERVYCTFDIPPSMTVKQVADGSGKLSAPEYSVNEIVISLTEISPSSVRLGNGLGNVKSYFFGSNPENNPTRQVLFVNGTGYYSYAAAKFDTDGRELLKGTGTAYSAKIRILGRAY